MSTPDSAPLPANILPPLRGLVIVSTLMQLAALTAPGLLAAGSPGRQVFSTVEMLLVLLMIGLSRRIHRWSRSQTQTVREAATLCLASLMFCAGGDLVNRNYFGDYYQWDAVIRHSYLIEAIAFFFPGYLLVLVANWRLTRAEVGPASRALTVVAALVLGTLAFLSSYRSDVNPLVSAAILAYTLLLSVMAGSTLWLWRRHGWRRARLVIVGVVLAPVADALIANFWIYSDHFPEIEHVNWILYYASLAMIQTLPLLEAGRRAPP